MLTSPSESVTVVIAARKDSWNIAANAELTREAGWQAEAQLNRSGPSCWELLRPCSLKPLPWSLVAVQKLVVPVSAKLAVVVMTGEILPPAHIPIPVHTRLARTG